MIDFNYIAGYIYPKGGMKAYKEDLKKYGYHNRKSLCFWWHQIDHMAGGFVYAPLSLILTGSPLGVTAGAVMKEAMDLSNQKKRGKKLDYGKSALDVIGWTLGACVWMLF